MKKTINNTLKSLFTAAVILFAFTACQELNIDSQDPAPTSVLVDGLDEYTVLAGSPSNIIFNISANTPWTITSDQQWCTPTPAMSAASSLVAEITLVTEPNETISDRTATLSITSEELGLIKEIKVKQVSKEKLIVIPYDEMVSSEGGDISFTIASNKPWEIIPSTQFLENIDKSSGEGTLNADKEIITLTIPANTAARRSGTLTVKTAFEEYTFEIKQDGIVFELEDPSESGSIDFGGLETEKTVKIVSNADWKAEVNKEFQDWISVEKVADDELKIKLIQRNNIFKTREGAITLKTTKLIPGFEGVEFPIKQATPFVFNGSSEEIIINEDTGSAKVVKNGNAIWSDYAFTTGHISFE
ncbi:MAG: BACON domain-containing protein, partial [Bacteroides sp.]